MGKYNVITMPVVSLIVLMVLAGCVERELTINTKPEGALVVLNDEEIGESPVTVSFNWYGDYCVRISSFPFDFFAQIVNPKRIVDSYEWTFELSPRRQISREELIQNANELKNQLQ